MQRDAVGGMAAFAGAVPEMPGRCLGLGARSRCLQALWEPAGTVEAAALILVPYAQVKHPAATGRKKQIFSSLL